MATQPEWGWTSYEKTSWGRIYPDGDRTLYVGRFMRLCEDGGYETQRIMFLAQHPMAALRFICHSGKHPRDFHEAVIN